MAVGDDFLQGDLVLDEEADFDIHRVEVLLQLFVAADRLHHDTLQLLHLKRPKRSLTLKWTTDKRSSNQPRKRVKKNRYDYWKTSKNRTNLEHHWNWKRNLKEAPKKKKKKWKKNLHFFIIIALSDIEQVEEASQRRQRRMSRLDGVEGAHGQPAPDVGLHHDHLPDVSLVVLHIDDAVAARLLLALLLPLTFIFFFKKKKIWNTSWMKHGYEKERLTVALPLDDATPPRLDPDDGIDVVLEVVEAQSDPLAHQEPARRCLERHLQTMGNSWR